MHPATALQQPIVYIIDEGLRRVCFDCENSAGMSGTVQPIPEKSPFAASWQQTLELGIGEVAPLAEFEQTELDVVDAHPA